MADSHMEKKALAATKMKRVNRSGAIVPSGSIKHLLNLLRLIFAENRFPTKLYMVYPALSICRIGAAGLAGKGDKYFSKLAFNRPKDPLFSLH